MSRKLHKRLLDRRIDGSAVPVHCMVIGGNDDHVSGGFRLHHDRCRLLHAEVRIFPVDVVHQIEGLLCHLQDGATLGDAGVVDEQVQSIKALTELRKESLCAACLGKVCRKNFRTHAVLCGQRFCQSPGAFLIRSGVDGYIVTVAGQHAGNPTAQSRSCARNQRGLLLHLFPSPLPFLLPISCRWRPRNTRDSTRPSAPTRRGSAGRCARR